MRALISIDGVDLPTPSTYKGTSQTLVDGDRNTNGVMIGQVVRDSLGRIDADYNYLTASQWSSILQMFNSAYGGNFSRDVTYFDETANDWVTKEMYVGDRTSSGVMQLDKSTGKPIGYTGAKLALIEV